MVYEKGVDDGCYNSPEYCHISFSQYNPGPGTITIREGKGNPNNGWIYNISNTDVYYVRLLISPLLSYGGRVLDVNFRGYIDESEVSGYGMVRPTLYLSSSVKIIDGDGSINNPYKLGL